MTDGELELINELILTETDINLLNYIKRIIEDHIKMVEVPIPFEQQRLLLQSFREFYDKNFTHDEKARVRFSDLNHAVIRLTNVKYKDIRVYDVVGLGKTKLLAAKKGLGTKTINKFESKLNQFGLSFDKALSDDQISMLDSLRNNVNVNNKQKTL